MAGVTQAPRIERKNVGSKITDSAIFQVLEARHPCARFPAAMLHSLHLVWTCMKPGCGETAAQAHTPDIIVDSPALCQTHRNNNFDRSRPYVAHHPRCIRFRLDDGL